MPTKDQIIENIRERYDIIFPSLRELEDIISNSLDNAGLFYRIFARKKTFASIKKKMDMKAENCYIPQGRKIQDIIGFRIVLYFADDVDICIKILQSMFAVNNYERDQLDTATFKPCRINYVFNIPEDSPLRLRQEISDECCVDNTFEVQMRTIFSEGWHEVEHDIRYKFKSDWENHMQLSRELNGLFAVLETCDHDIISICDKFAYENYKCRNWEAMIRNKYRLRFQEREIRQELKEYLTVNTGVAKQIFRFKREKLIDILCRTKIVVNYDNVVYIINFLEIKDTMIQEMTPKVICRKLESVTI